jgi:hypothetical protein
MMTMVRGSNPIWFEVDLTAHAFDDTFYMFVLKNEIPYIPATVWQDPFGNVEWTNPIRFLANGTLPNNIYYDPDTVYRLEFRQGDTQSDPLIYLVENYVPGSSGDTPVNETSFSTDNQISNPQFALINFTSPLTLTSVSTQTINLAPGWFLDLTGTGNVTLTRVLLNSAVVDQTNASYALQIQLSGTWTGAILRQRFNQNGVLWSNSFVSSSITALSGNAPQNISAKLVDSQGNTLTSVLRTTALTESFNEYKDVGQILNSINTDFPPSAYIEYQLTLPINCNVTLTSFQLISGDVQITYPYEQDTIERQIDQTYHNAFPIVPIGTVIDFAGFTVPLHYYLCDGSAKNRITDDLLFHTVTTTETVTLTNTVNTFTVVSVANYHIGMAIEGTGIPASTTISNISGSTITMSAAATATGPSTVRFFAWGAGDGSTTFNVPNLQGFVTAGANGTLFAGVVNGTGLTGGAATHAITIAEMPAHNHPGSTVAISNGTQVNPPGGNASMQSLSGTKAVDVAAQGGGTLNVSGSPMSLIQPTALMKKCIRYEY